MELIDLFSMRESFNRQSVILCFNGPISRSLIEEIGNALRHYLETDRTSPSAAMDVFSVYIELTQNIRHYVTQHNWSEPDTSATVIVANNSDGQYQVSAGNMVELADGEALLKKVNELSTLDKAQLKARYKEQLHKPREVGVASGAGLGMIDIARKAKKPIQASLKTLDDGRAFISLSVTI
jgi:hypothetical protein